MGINKLLRTPTNGATGMVSWAQEIPEVEMWIWPCSSFSSFWLGDLPQ